MQRSVPYFRPQFRSAPFREIVPAADGVQESFRLQAEQFLPEGKGTFIPALFCVFLDFSLDDLRTYVQTKPRNASQPRTSPRMHPQLTTLRKLSDDGNQLGPTFTVPLNASLKVVLGYPVAQLERVYNMSLPSHSGL